MKATHSRRTAGLLAAAAAAALLLPATTRADMKEHSLKIASAQAVDHPFSMGAQKFADLLADRSGGKIKAKLYAGAVLGGDAQVISSLQGGTVDVTVVSTGLLSTMNKDFAVYYLPMAFQDSKEADAVVDGPFGRKLLDKLPEKGLVGLAYWEHGFRSVTNSKRPIAKAEDFKGLKLRVIQVPIFIDIYNTLGANAVPMPFPELYTALESKAVDGQENPLPTIEAARFPEVQKHLSLTRLVYDPLVVLFSKKTWDRLSEDERKVVADAAKEATSYQRKLNREREAAMVKNATAKGLLVNDVSAAERERMREQLRPVVEKHAKLLDPALLAEFQAEIGKLRVAATSRQRRAPAATVAGHAPSLESPAMLTSIEEQPITRPVAGPHPRVIRLHPEDDVVVALDQLVSGMTLASEGLVVSGLVPPGHKVATRAVAAGAPVRRYGQIIGFASQPIRPGQHVHTHNLAMGEFARDYAYGTEARETPRAAAPATFQGIVREDGRIATRNYIGILTSVNCSATVARAIADHFRRDIRPEALAAFPNVDGVVALTHDSGCAIDSEGEGLKVLQRTLGGYACHPNFAAVLVVGLGCETNQIPRLLETQGLAASDRLRAYTIQDVGGTTRAIARGVEIVQQMLPGANEVVRQSVPASRLVVGLQCGGSDGYSGISANPVLGAAVDLLVAHGGTALLSETPEIYGAEHLLTRRARTPEVGRKLVERIRWWEDHCARNGAQMNNNPSAGNKAGGLTTVLEKSMGGIAKGGSTALNDVVEYAEPVKSRGLVFMDTPGYDPVSATGQVAGGANLICFTTGRGSAYGCAPSPSLKLATNTALWERQSDDMDLNCGEVLSGEVSIAALGERLFRLMLDTASGQRSRSELHGYGQNEFVPWQISVVT